MILRVSHLWPEYLAAHGDELSPATVRRYRQVVRKLEGHFGPTTRLDEIDREKAAKFKAKLAKTLEPTTVAKNLAVAKLLFGELVDQERIGRNPFAKIRTYAPPPDGEWPIITVEQVWTIIGHARGDGLKMAFALCGLCGLRISQARALRWKHVRLSENRLAVDAQQRRRSTKHRLHFPPIEPSKCPSGMHDYMTAAYRGRPNDLVCGKLSFWDIRQMAPGALRAAVADGVPEYPKPFHGLRRSTACRWVASYPESTVAAWLGHSLICSIRHYRSVDEAVYLR